MPAALIGKWNQNRDNCDAAVASEGRLTITARSLKFYEGTSTVLSVRTLGNTSTVKVAWSAEGSTGERSIVFTLSSNAQQVSFTMSDVPGFEGVRYRCS